MGRTITLRVLQRAPRVNMPSGSSSSSTLGRQGQRPSARVTRPHVSVRQQGSRRQRLTTRRGVRKQRSARG